MKFTTRTGAVPVAVKIQQANESEDSITVSLPLTPLSPKTERELRNSCFALLSPTEEPIKAPTTNQQLLVPPGAEETVFLQTATVSLATASKPRTPTLVQHRISAAPSAATMDRPARTSSINPALITRTPSTPYLFSKTAIARKHSLDVSGPPTYDTTTSPLLPRISPSSRISRNSPKLPPIITSTLHESDTDSTSSTTSSSSPGDSPITSPSITGSYRPRTSSIPQHTNHRASSIPVMVARPTLITVAKLAPPTTVGAVSERPKTSGAATGSWAQEFEQRKQAASAPTSTTTGFGEALSLFPRPRTAGNDRPVTPSPEPLPAKGSALHPRKVVPLQAPQQARDEKKFGAWKKIPSWWKIGTDKVVGGLVRRKHSAPSVQVGA